MKPPFPYFGGKRWLAEQVWRWLGADVRRYIEPFAGGLGVLLARPGGPRPRWQEVINDEYAHIANVWRAVKYHGDQVWANCQDPLHEADLHGRTQRLIAVEASYRDAMFADPTWCDPQLAGWWIWAQSAHLAQAVVKSGVKSKPNATPQGVFSVAFCRQAFDEFTRRLQTVQILCGVLANCDHPRLRIVLSGYRGSPGDEALMAAGMVRHDFSAPVGHGVKGQENRNNELEACWVSRACLGGERTQLGLGLE
ncbi:MAG: hypothetical protein E6R03_06195 [Hyphomicrobiaceae bacterium]|nr:MAG: hypothetical protein E6R03_06195 [Hyphomicrobiaceae bacterium]